MVSGRVTVQQALLLRLRDQALRGELWAQKLLQKVVGALPESGSEYDYIEMQLHHVPNSALSICVRRSGLDGARCGGELSGMQECRVMTAPSATRGHRFTAAQKGQSGNPRGRPKKVPDFMEDAAEILGGTVTGQAKGKPITLPMVQAMFRTLCRAGAQRRQPSPATGRRADVDLGARCPRQGRRGRREGKGDPTGSRKFDRLMGLDPDEMEAQSLTRRGKEREAPDAMVRKSAGA